MPKGIVKHNTETDMEQMVNEYRKIRPIHEEFCRKLKILLQDLLTSESIRFQVVEARAKTLNSFSEKIKRDGKVPTDPLQNITDLSGLRIIVYYDDDIDKVCTMLEREFKIDKSRSVDKRLTVAPDRFGYLSVHKIVSLSDARAKLPEWSSYRQLVAEIQVRTVLQHAWAAISHALQYKRETDIPSQLRRKLTRLSGLLELADEQFSTLRQEQAALEKEITERIQELDLGISIDMIAVEKFVSTSENSKKLAQIVEGAGLGVSTMPSASGQSHLVTVCNMVGIKDVASLEKQLSSLMPKAKSFFDKFSSVYPGAGGGLAHWLAVAIVGFQRKRLTKAKLVSTVGWSSDYAHYALLAGQVFEDV